MKRFAAVGVALAAVSAFAQEAEPETFDRLGLSIELDFGQTEVAKRFQAKDYKGALEELEAQLKLLGRADESVPQRWKDRREANVRYDMACARARLGEADAAVAEFVRAVELGFWDWKHLAQDGDLDTIRERPEFVAAVEAGKAAEALEVKALVAAAVADVERSLAEGPLVADYDLSGELLGGGRFALADHKGKVVLIAQFFASYGSERVLFPHLPLLNELAAAYKDKPLACAGAAFKIAGDPDGELLTELVERTKLSYPVVVVRPDQIVLESRLLVVGPDGAVRAALRAPRVEVLRAVIEKLLPAEAPAGR